MRDICDITENEMIARFLAEVDSDRFGECIRNQLRVTGTDERIIGTPDLRNEDENNRRRTIWKHCRHGLLQGFPPTVHWVRAALTKDDLAKVKYLKQPEGWMKLSGDSRLAVDAVLSIRNGATIPDISSEGFQKAVEAVKNGAAFPEMIVVSADEGLTLVLLEGHKRLTAYLFNPEFTPEELKVIVGFSAAFIGWPLY